MTAARAERFPEVIGLEVLRSKHGVWHAKRYWDDGETSVRWLNDTRTREHPFNGRDAFERAKPIAAEFGLVLQEITQ